MHCFFQVIEGNTEKVMLTLSGDAAATAFCTWQDGTAGPGVGDDGCPLEIVEFNGDFYYNLYV